ncbi:MAG: amidohydrolase family protein [Actinomycetales bacterium]
MTALLIENVHILTVDAEDRRYPDGFLLIEDGAITGLGPMSARPSVSPQIERINGAGPDGSCQIAFPGFINTHTHSFQALTRGVGEGLPVWEWFSQALDLVVGHLTVEDARLAAQVTALESLRSGCTTVVDYNYPHPQAKMADAAIEGFREVGVRTILARGIIDTGDVHPTIVHDTASEMADCRRLLEKFHRTDGDLIRIWLAPYTIFSTSTQAMLASHALAEEFVTGVTIHAATPSTLEAAQALFGTTDIVHEEGLGMLGPNLLLVHCTHPGQIEQALMADHLVKVSHNPASNAYLGEGASPIVDLLARGITVGLGTDGPASNNNQDMLAVLKLTALIQKMLHQDPAVIDARTVLQMATQGGAACVGWSDGIGSLEVGKRADIVLMDPWSASTVAFADPAVSLVYSATQENIRTVLVDGRVMMRDRQVLGNSGTLDEMAILRRAQQAGVNLRARSGI